MAGGPKNVDVNIRGNDQTKAAFDSAKKNAETFGADLKDTLNAPFEFIKALFAVELVKVVGEFFKSTVEAAAESEAAWSRVGQAVENAGINFQGVRGELKETFEAISDKTRFSEKELQDGFATVLNVTNDYKGSIKNLGLITDIAIAKQIDLNTAATIVGKAMDGQTTMLKRYGIIIKDGADAMTELSKRFSGFAERDGLSLQGRIHQLANEWEEFKIQVGEAVTGTNSASDAIGKLTKALETSASWIEKNRSAFREWATEFSLGWKTITDAIDNSPFAPGVTIGSGKQKIQAALAQGAAMGEAADMADKTPEHGDAAYHRALAAERARNQRITEQQIEANNEQAAQERARIAEEKADKALTKRIADLKAEGDEILKARETENLSNADYEKLAKVWTDLLNTSKDTTKSLKERNAAAEELKKISDASKKTSDELLKNAKEIQAIENKGTSIAALSDKDHISALLEGPDHAGTQAAGQINFRASASALPSAPNLGGNRFGAGVAGAMKEALGVTKDLQIELEGVGDTLSDITGGALVNFIGTWEQGLQEVIAGHESLGAAIVQSVRKAIGASLSAKGQETLLDAAKSAAMGIWPPNPALLAQAAQLFGIGSAEIAAGALFGGSSSGGGARSYGGASGGLGPTSFSSSQSTATNAAPGTLVINGRYVQFDTRDPEQRDAFVQMIQAIFGNREMPNIVFTDAAA